MNYCATQTFPRSNSTPWLLAVARGPSRVCASRVLAGIDARIGDVYWGAYRLGADGLMAPQGDERVLPPAAVPLPADTGWYGAGSAWVVYGDVLRARLQTQLAATIDAAWCPHAQDVARLAEAAYRRGDVVAAAAAAPVYLRDDVAVKQTSG